MAKQLASSKRASAERGNDNPKQTDPPKWSPGRFAVWSRRRSDPGNPSAITLMLRHPSAPFTAGVNDLDDETLRSVALSYLRSAISLEIEPRLELERVLKALDTNTKNRDADFAVEWLPIQWPEKDGTAAGRFGSFRAKRISASHPLADQIIILMASEPERERPSGREIGLRVVLHACEREINENAYKFDIRITGLSGSLRLDPPPARGTSGKSLPRSKSRAFLNSELQPSSFEAGRASLFRIDPASDGDATTYRDRRPTRSEKDFKPFRKPIPDGMQVQSSQNPEYMEVGAASEFVPVNAGAKFQISQNDSGGAPEVRSNQFAAESASKNFGDFFDRLEAYGLGVDDYFRLAQLPLKIAYRSGIVPGRGKDGQVVNARVYPEDWPATAAGPEKLCTCPSLTVHLALANLRHRGRKPWNGNRPTPAEPMGIAADARWIWHEIGHVALMASTGELEFRFAHSAGDALAAIAMDPFSKLAANPVARGLTFPWVFIPRRHDRCVKHGWSWGGTMHRAAAQAPYVVPQPRKAYLTEQILSSSLFRLYRCLGGDPDPDKLESEPSEHRQLASHYTLYLILRAMQIMGTTGIVVGNDPDDFVSALIDSDVGTHLWDVTYPAPDKVKRFTRVGGCAHKAIRWAFEAQGLYAPDGVITNGPGSPPPVDIFIADNRPPCDVTPDATIVYGPGNYLPVSLDWDRKSDGRVPLWQAPDTAMDVQGNDIRITVGNRGSQTAVGVKVRVWYRECPKGEDPTWQGGADWTECEAAKSDGQSIDAGQKQTFGPFKHKAPTTRYIVLAQASCNDDLANIDPAAKLPCGSLETDLRDLVAGDNNLALRALKEN